MALKPFPLFPGPMYKNAPVPALKELWLQDVPLATPGKRHSFPPNRIGGI